MNLATVIRSEEKWLLPTYDRQKVLFEKGRGLYLWDSRGNRYLDFLSGIGVNALGHSHPAISSTLKKFMFPIFSFMSTRQSSRNA